MSAIEGKAAVRKCNNSTTLDYRTSVVGVHTLLFAQVCSSNTDLHNSRLVDPGHSYVFENLVIDFALALPESRRRLPPLSSGQNAEAWGSFASFGLKVKSTPVLVK